jgi:hypothetical protein
LTVFTASATFLQTIAGGLVLATKHGVQADMKVDQ